MEYARHHAEANRHVDGVPQWEYWQHAAQRGNPEAIARLQGPPYPEELDYLWRWAQDLHGRSGIGMAGIEPLTYSTIHSWAELTDQWPEPHEVEALILLDAVMRNPERPPERKQAAEPKPDAPWPDKKE